MPEPDAVVLPNGLAIYEINAYETRFLYKEIFEDVVYLRHGVRLPEDAVVFDVGANIGLFSLFCLATAPRGKVFAFEPAPHCVAHLRQNLRQVADRVEIVEAALLDTSGPQHFTYYPHYSIMSGLKADRAGDADTLRKGAANQLGVDMSQPKARKMVDLLVDGKLVDPVAFECEGLTVSDVIRAHGVDRIDLLKIDVEKAEGLVLQGVAPEDWPKINQVVLEAHDLGGGEHHAIEAMLKEKGFTTVVDNSDELAQSALYNIYAVRSKDPR